MCQNKVWIRRVQANYYGGLLMKPTIFFSHSSKDKESLIVLKDIIEEKTGGTINIFMSSDGQSIPFGSNWMYKIEEGLKDAKIMFVFVTPKSIDTGWIYFEAGYAYSKGIEVIPIGINVDIGSIKPPISLLQGFNMISAESINNIIHIINKKFSFSFKADFSENEFNRIDYINNSSKSLFLGEEIIDSITTEVFSYKNEDKEININCEETFKLIENKLREYNIEYCSGSRENKMILINGLKIIHDKKEDSIEFKMDSIGLINNFKMVNNIINDCYADYNGKNPHYIEIKVKDNYELLGDDIKISSKIIHNDVFSISKDMIGYFNYKQYKFIVEEEKETSIVTAKPVERKIRLAYPTDNFNIDEILELIYELHKMDIIKNK